MIVDVQVPNQGLTITEATLIRWANQPGDTVAEGDVLFEIETDKAAQEIESPVSGTLLVQLAQIGEVVKLGAIIGKIGTEAGDQVDGADVGLMREAIGGSSAANTSVAISASQSTRVGSSGRPVVASPRAKRTAHQLGIDLSLVAPTGRRGAHIRERDVLLAADRIRSAAVTREDTANPVEQMKSGTVSVPGRIRRITAERTTASFRDVPHFFLTREIGAERLCAFREEVSANMAEYSPLRVTFTDMLVKALALALDATPELNVQWRDNEIVTLGSCDVGLAVDTPEGLVVPVIRDASRKSLVAIAGARTRLIQTAREGRLTLPEISGGSFTLSNLGTSGIDQFQAIINTPESGILAVGSIKPRPFVRDGVMAVERTLIATGSFDHRVVDGAIAARFLDRFAKLIECPSLAASL